MSHPSLAALLLVLCSLPTLGQSRAVRVARSADGTREAWIEARAGLVLIEPGRGGTRLALGQGAFPRFLSDGTLIFERSRDDGHELTQRTLFRLVPGSLTPHPLPPAAPPPAYRPPPFPPRRAGVIALCIDPGHGGSDPGAVAFGLQEKDLTLEVALRLERLLALDSGDPRGGGDWDVLLTRDSDQYVGLAERATLANAFGAKSFLSIHVNSFSSPSANGTETYCYLGQSANAGGALRDAVQEQSLRAFGLRNRGVKEANFAVLRLTAMPAALAESGFLTSPIDFQKLSDPAARRDLALGYLFALQVHHGFEPYDPRPAGGTLGQPSASPTPVLPWILLRQIPGVPWMRPAERL